MTGTDHLWTVVTARNGKPCKQRQCSRCEIWETAISRSTECVPAIPSSKEPTE